VSDVAEQVHGLVDQRGVVTLLGDAGTEERRGEEVRLVRVVAELVGENLRVAGDHRLGAGLLPAILVLMVLMMLGRPFEVPAIIARRSSW
jgi:hypothetical protein